jgi:hypothetical protein
VFGIGRKCRSDLGKVALALFLAGRGDFMAIGRTVPEQSSGVRSCYATIVAKKDLIPRSLYLALKRFYGSGSEAYCLAQRQLEPELRVTRNYTLLMRNWRGNRNRDFF